MKNRNFLTRVGFAVAGIAIVWNRERSFRTQIACAAGGAAAMVLLHASLVWIALLSLSTALVLALELANSALEYLIDHLHPARAEEIRHAKDAAAGAVLIVSIGACAVGLSFMFASG